MLNLNDLEKKHHCLQHKRNHSITWKPTLTDQRAQEEKKALQQHSRTSLKEGHYHKKHLSIQLK